MAIFYPTIEEIKNMVPLPTEGEIELLEYLQKILRNDNSWEVFFQPHFYGMRPDIMILRKNHGVWIIEVKDWNLESYRINNKNWEVYDNFSGKYITIKSPFQQVQDYKDMIYSFYSIELNFNPEKPRNNDLYSLINVAVYFSHNPKKEVIEFLRDEENILLNINNIFSQYQFSSSKRFITKNDLISNSAYRLLLFNYMGKKTSRYFTDDIYNELKRILTLSEDEINNNSLSNDISLTTEQKKSNTRKKIYRF